MQVNKWHKSFLKWFGKIIYMYLPSTKRVIAASCCCVSSYEFTEQLKQS